jgi:hypothetical protein
MFDSGACTCATVIVAEEWTTESGPGMPVAFEIISKPQTN